MSKNRETRCGTQLALREGMPLALWATFFPTLVAVAIFVGTFRIRRRTPAAPARSRR